jgi:phosphoglycerol transferase MdoB-like AlkP superfamily enzyme
LALLLYFLYIFFLTSYFSYFGFIPEVYAFGASNISDTLEVINHYFRQVFGVSEVAILLTMASCFYLASKVQLNKKILLVLLLPISLFLVSYNQFGAPINNEKYGNVTVIRRFGVISFLYLSFSEWLSIDGNYFAPKTTYPGKLTSIIFPQQNSDISFAKLPNDILHTVLIQIESLDLEAIDAQLNGIDVMPFLQNLKDSCLNYTNFYTTKSVGGSADAEFSIATGLLPSSKRPSISHANFDAMSTMYEILKRQNVDSYFAHNNQIGFYSRNIAYSKLDVHHRFLLPTENISEPEFAKDSFAFALANSKRSFYYFFNFQSHGPYMGYSDATAAKFAMDSKLNLVENYLATMHEVDEMIGSLFAMQRAFFNENRSVFILTADHPSYLHTNSSLTNRTNIPLLICHNSFKRTDINKISSTVDLFPTILETFGVDSEAGNIGSSLFRNNNGVVLFPTGKILYRDKNNVLKSEQCIEKCDGYFDFTDQHIGLSQ